MTYREIEIKKTGRAAWDYYALIGARHRWGTREELKADIDAHLDGMGLPTAQRGYA